MNYHFRTAQERNDFIHSLVRKIEAAKAAPVDSEPDCSTCVHYRCCKFADHSAEENFYLDDLYADGEFEDCCGDEEFEDCCGDEENEEFGSDSYDDDESDAYDEEDEEEIHYAALADELRDTTPEKHAADLIVDLLAELRDAAWEIETELQDMREVLLRLQKPKRN